MIARKRNLFCSFSQGLRSDKLEYWAARYNTWLLIKLTPKGVLFSFLSLRWYATAKQPRLFTVLLPSAVPAQHKQSLCKLECISMV